MHKLPQASRTEIAARLRVTRQAFGMGQYDFADRAGIAGNTYNQYEQAKKRPTIENALALCRAYGLTLDWVYAGDPSGLPYKVADAIKSIKILHGGQE